MRNWVDLLVAELSILYKYTDKFVIWFEVPVSQILLNSLRTSKGTKSIKQKATPAPYVA